MSHFKLTVFAKDQDQVGKLLAPYQENNMGDCPKKYLEFKSVEEETREKYENGTFLSALIDGEYFFRNDERFRKFLTPEEVESYDGDKLDIGTEWSIHSGNNKYIMDYEGFDFKEHPFKEMYSSYEEFMSDWEGHDEVDTEMMEYGYWYNPNAKWDWWQFGGRYGDVVAEKIKDINFDVDMDEYEDNIRYWEIAVEESPLKEGEEKPFIMYKKEYFLETYKTKEEYALQYSLKNRAYAFITPDGKWFDKGQMYMFGMSGQTDESRKEYNELYDEFINDPDNQDLYMFVVDCHI